jgi:hypothetical protein
MALTGVAPDQSVVAVSGFTNKGATSTRKIQQLNATPELTVIEAIGKLDLLIGNSYPEPEHVPVFNRIDHPQRPIMGSEQEQCEIVR